MTRTLVTWPGSTLSHMQLLTWLGQTSNFPSNTCLGGSKNELYSHITLSISTSCFSKENMCYLNDTKVNFYLTPRQPRQGLNWLLLLTVCRALLLLWRARLVLGSWWNGIWLYFGGYGQKHLLGSFFRVQLFHNDAMSETQREPWVQNERRNMNLGSLLRSPKPPPKWTMPSCRFLEQPFHCWSLKLGLWI